MSKPKEVIVRGRNTLVGMQIPPRATGLDKLGGAYLSFIQAGTNYLEAVIRFLLNLGKGGAAVQNSAPLSHTLERMVLLKNTGPMQSKGVGGQSVIHTGPDGKTLPCLRIEEEWDEAHAGGNFAGKPGGAPEGDASTVLKSGKPRVLVDYITKGVEELKSFPAEDLFPEGSFHIQITADGCLETVAECKGSPTVPRIVVLSLKELVAKNRIRKGLSYDAVVVDLLRMIRGEKEHPVYWRSGEKRTPDQETLIRILGIDPDSPDSAHRKEGVTFISHRVILIVRISSVAAFIYEPSRKSGNEGEQKEAPGQATGQHAEKARIVYLKDRTAPFDNPDLGKMRGYTGILACFIASMAVNGEEGDLLTLVENAVIKCLCWQDEMFRQGWFLALFENRGSGWKAFGKPDWTERIPAGRPWTVPGNRSWLASVARQLAGPEGIASLKNKPPVAIECKGATSREIDIFGAASHRMQWFLFYKKDWLDAAGEPQGALKLAMKWLSKPGEKPDDDFPIVRLGKLALLDRREIEDYLGIFNAISAYGRNMAAPAPLNIAVFGPPGAGKSFGVTQIAAHLETTMPQFKGDPLTFNMSQLQSPGELAAALHKVRNRCLEGKTPVVFFDEFDAPLHGQPYGWLKYFLAPMQDGKFMDGGEIHNLGRCILVFAGGINRTFEEFNSRVRSQVFCEAKGPDFVSRLRAHLNVWGVNRPTDAIASADMGRYMLRRALMLRQSLGDLLDFQDKTKPVRYMQDSLANAFCRVSGFKHGARSLTAILNMSDIKKGQPFGPSDLPPKFQLEMHVNASEFLDLVFDYKP